MPGSSAFTSYDLPLDGDAIPLLVWRYARTNDPGGRITTALLNVRCTQIQYFDGPHPPAARFEYIFDDSGYYDFPNQFEAVWPITASGRYVVQNDDEIVVLAYAQDGSWKCLFHGFAQIPQVDISPENQAVTFVAVGVAIRCWDTPIGGAVYRNASDPASTDPGDQIPTDLRVQFNPSTRVNGYPTIQPNCSYHIYDVGEGTRTAYPVFIDWNIRRNPDRRDYWTLDGMVRYILMVHNGEDDPFIANPDMRTLTAILQEYAPKSGEFYDPNDPAASDSKPIHVRDFDATNMAWPDAIYGQIIKHGFSFFFSIDTDKNGEPRDGIQFYRKDAKTAQAPLPLSLQPQGSILNPGKTSVQRFHVARDTHSIANRWIVETRPVLYEVSVILAPDFTPLAADATNIGQFDKNNLDGATDLVRAKYRRYVFDEAGDGHWSYASSSIVQTITDLSPILGNPKKLESGRDGPPVFAERCRPGRTTLISVDQSGRPRPAQLAMSRDYAGATAGNCPAIWDGTGHWQPIAGGWELLKDRLGIYVNCQNVEQWNIGKNNLGANVQNADEKLSGITSQANPTANTTAGKNTARFFLRLTTVIEGDAMLEAVAEKRKASPTKYPITRRVEAGDHFQKQVISAPSLYNAASGAKAITDPTPDATTGISPVRDDTEKALAHAKAFRAAHEFPPLAGSVTIPWLSLAYSIGQRINVIAGRNVSLQANIGADQGEAKEFPWVESLTWSFTGEQQSTTLQLSDRRAEPQRA